MDWVWRIGFFIILYFIGQTLADVELVTSNYSSRRVDETAALLNALLPSLIIAFGALPLGMKIIRKKKTSAATDKPTNFSHPRHSYEEMLPISRRPSKTNVNSTSQPAVSDTEKNEKNLQIFAPAVLDYSKRCIIRWFVKEGQAVKPGDKIFCINETKGQKDAMKNFTLVATKEYIVKNRNIGVSKRDEVVHHRDILICELASTENVEAKSVEKVSSKKQTDISRINEPKSVNKRRQKTKKQIEADLVELKKLKENGLISQEVWTEKQKQILKDY